MSLVRIDNRVSLSDREIRELGDVLIDCVEGGASVSFMLPMTRAKADAFWRDAAASAERGERVIIVAEVAGEIVGTAQVVWAWPENQPHRADLSKMLVLDTVTGSDASRLYTRNGWQRAGDIPDYALWPDGRPCSTTYFYKRLVD